MVSFFRTVVELLLDVKTLQYRKYCIFHVYPPYGVVASVNMLNESSIRIKSKYVNVEK